MKKLSIKSFIICLLVIGATSCSSLRTYETSYEHATSKLKTASVKLNRHALALVENPNSEFALYKPDFLGYDDYNKVTSNYIEFDNGREFSFTLRGLKKNELDIIETSIVIYRQSNTQILVDIETRDIEMNNIIRPDIQQQVYNALEKLWNCRSSFSFSDKKAN